MICIFLLIFPVSDVPTKDPVALLAKFLDSCIHHALNKRMKDVSDCQLFQIACVKKVYKIVHSHGSRLPGIYF